MLLPCCPFCKESFTRSRFHPDQIVCSGPDCQRQRRAAYHRQKLQADPSYRDQCRDSQQQWREQQPEYMRTYRAEHQITQNAATRGGITGSRPAPGMGEEQRGYRPKGLSCNDIAHWPGGCKEHRSYGGTHSCARTSERLAVTACCKEHLVGHSSASVV
jgi:hypothetical protein